MDFSTYFYIVGTLATMWMIYKGGKFLLNLGGWMLEAAFRDKFPYDYEMNLSWITQKFRDLGYRKVFAIEPGGDAPGFFFKKSKCKTEVEVRLNAPLFTSEKNSVVIVNYANNIAIVMPDSCSDENKCLLEKFCELLE